MAAPTAVTQVWFISRHYSPNFSGATIQATQILERLARQGYRVFVLTAADLLARDLRSQEVEVDGVVVRYLPFGRGWSRARLEGMSGLRRIALRLYILARDLSFNVRCGWVLFREGRKHDIVQFYGVREFTFLAAALARARGMHTIVKLTLLGSDDPSSIARGGRGVLTFLRLLTFRFAEAVVGNSTAQIESCMAAGFLRSRVIRIPGGVDLDGFRPVDAETRTRLCAALGLDRERRYVAFVGSAIHRKGIDVLLRAFAPVAQQIDDVDLLVVGPSELLDPARYPPDQQELVERLRQEIAGAGWESRIYWTGQVDNVHHYLQVSEVFCFPTRREGFGNVLPEAMAVGLPVVAARLDGVTTDIVNDGKEGYLIVGHRPADYAKALMLVLRDADLAAQLGAAARRRAVSDYDLNKIAARFGKLYRMLQGQQQLETGNVWTHSGRSD